MAGTVNCWNNQIGASYNQIILNAGTNGVAISTDASAATVNVATGGAVKTTTLGSTNSTSATTVQSGSGALNITSASGAITINSGTGILAISNDASATTVNIGTGAANKGVTLGSQNTSSTTTIQAGGGNINILTNSGTGSIIMNSSPGNIQIANDAADSIAVFGSGAGVKQVTIGSTTSTSVTTIQSGSSALTLTTNGGNANIVLTPNGTGKVTTANNLDCAGISFDSGTNRVSTYTASTNFTPVLNFGGATTGITYSVQSGTYTRLGSLGIFSLQFILTSKGSATGSATVTGLPIAPNSNIGAAFSVRFSNLTFVGQVIARAAAASGTINLESAATTGAVAALSDTAFAANTLFIITRCFPL